MLDTEDFAQLTYQGVTVIGSSQNDKTSFKVLGMICELRSTQGVITNTGGFVQSWNDMSGSGNNFYQYTRGIQPTFAASTTTNNFPAIMFTNATQNWVLQNLGFGQKFSGINKPFTVIVLENALTNGANPSVFSMGWTSASNQSASTFQIHPNVNTVTTCQFELAVDTNQASVVRNLTSSTTTNIFHYLGVTYDGANATIYDNLRASTPLAFASNVPRTCDTCTLGLWARTNLTVTAGWTGSLSGLWVFTNGLSGSNYTNFLNTLNNGRFHVY